MKILVTGADGFIGKNLIEQLKSLSEHEILRYDKDTGLDLLKSYCGECEFVFHLAGVNRPENPSEYMEGNFGFTSQLLSLLKEYKNVCPIMLSSSIQAELDNPYGKSKKEGEELLRLYGAETGARVLIYRFPNVFGKWCRPNYNSAVATFCYNIAHDLPVQVNGRETKLSLVYIDDVVEELLCVLDGNDNRKEGSNKKRNENRNRNENEDRNKNENENRNRNENENEKQNQNENENRNETENENRVKNGFCHVKTVYSVTLGEVVNLLYSFKESRTTLLIPDMTDGSFSKKLYSTYLSYLPAEEFIYPLKMNIDDRGSFTEIIRTENRGQFSVNISKLGIEKGNHWHNTKNEKFVVVSGNALIQFRKPDSGDIISFHVSGEKIEVVDIPVGYTHNIINEGNTELITFMWCNECFSPEKPDTFFLKVNE